MTHPELLLLVKFKSALSFEQVTKVIDSRIDDFRALSGLQQKYYLQDSATGEYAGLYLWGSSGAFAEFRDSELRATIAAAYQTQGEPRIEVFQVIQTLRDTA
jgi:heme-degrading monooxygenase HmoA